MTRINIGVCPSDLCDQHLVAEYRELPRMTAFAVKRLMLHNGPGPRPVEPTMGTGHMAYFLPYGASLEARWRSLVGEMKYRGFAVSFGWRDYPAALCGDIPVQHERLAGELIRARIIERLRGMRRPRWTGRCRPAWSYE